MQPIRSVAFVVNAGKDGAVQLAEELSDFCAERGVPTRTTSEHPLPPDFLSGQDACCVLGGDGTLLATVPQAVHYNVPVFGINRGKLGFLATLNASNARYSLDRILDGEFRIEQRAVLRCRTADGKDGLVLNDIVVKHRASAPISGLRVLCDDELVTHYYCDGLIFSTPTGSTAYNLSAGGPLIAPMSRVIAMTPICPHTLTNRSLIFPHLVTLQVECEEQEPMPTVILDGRLVFDGAQSFPLRITVAPEPFLLLQPPDHSHFRILRSKLRWGGHEQED